MMIKPSTLIDINYTVLDKELDKTKTKVFLSKNAAFLGPLMCAANFVWTEDIHTASTNGATIYWNPHWFLKLPPETRISVLLHELWHIAFMHMIRCGDRNPKVWNYACDYVINNMLLASKYTFIGIYPLSNPIYDNMTAEAVYDELMLLPENETFLWGVTVEINGETTGDTGDLIEPEGEAEAAIVNAVVQATTSAKLSGMGAGDVPAEIETMLKQFLQPKLPWEMLLYLFFNDICSQDYSWARPNRRYPDIYLPSLQDENNGLDHLIYYLDVSGSVSDGQVIRFNSEVKYIKDTFNPVRLTLVLFDDKIQREYEFYQEDVFEEIIIIGRGGTSLEPVREHMLKHMPQAAIIFSDMQCSPMDNLPNGVNIPTIFVGLNASKDTKINFGKLIHIKE